MKNAQTFSNKVFELALLSDYERIASSFNRLLHSFYLKERNVFRQLRTLRQARIRLDMAVRTYEVAPRQSGLCRETTQSRGGTAGDDCIG